MISLSFEDETKIASAAMAAFAAAAVFVLVPLAWAMWSTGHVPESAPAALLGASLQMIPGALLGLAALSLRRVGRPESDDDDQLLAGLQRLRFYFAVQCVFVLGTAAILGAAYAMAHMLALLVRVRRSAPRCG